MMFGVPGWIEMFLLLSMSGSAGIPLGVPPLPEDPLMARIPAEECVFYTTWSGVAKPDAAGGNRTEALLAEKEIQHALAELEKVAVRGLQHSAQEGDGAEAVLLGELFPKLGKLALTRPTCLYVTKLEMKDAGPEMQAGLVIRVDGQGPEIRRIIERLENAVAAKTASEVEIEGSKYHRLDIGAGVPAVTWGIRGKYLIVCMGKNAVVDMFDSVRAGQPKWLTELRKKLPVERVSTVSYGNLEKLFELAKMPGPVPLAMLIEASGLNNLTTYGSVTGLDKTGFVHRTAIGIDGEAKGILSLLDVKPLSKDDLARIPADAPAALALRLNPEKTYNNFIEMIAGMNGLTPKDMEAQIERGAGTFGIKVREQVVASLGDNGYIYAAPQDGDLLTGWTGVVQIRDHMTLYQVHEKLVGMFQQKLQADVERGRRRVPKIKSVMVKHHKVYFLSVPDDDVPFSPSWCLTRDGLVFGLFPQAVKAHILRDAPSQSLVDLPVLAKRFNGAEDGPVAFTYFDSKRVVELVYPFAQIGIQGLANELRREGFDLDVTMLPSVASITKHLQPRVNVVRRTGAGIELEGHQVLPGGSLGSTAPFIASLSIPAAISARKAARRMQAQGQMRQITLALHNYHDVHKGFPAAYSTDKDGKPLLSWRVHILPYLEEKALYDRFHLDEPWDSDHNKKLIEAMPRIYRSPASKSKPGHTNFLAIRGENAVFVPPEGDQKGRETPIGTRLADIKDGASNTIITVEGNDSAVVPWTKPDDFAAGQKEPLKTLTGLHGSGFVAGFADGSVRYGYGSVSTGNLKLLFDRRDGKRIDPDVLHAGVGRFGGGHAIGHDHVHLEPDVEVEVRELKVDDRVEPERKKEPTEAAPQDGDKR